MNLPNLVLTLIGSSSPRFLPGVNPTWSFPTNSTKGQPNPEVPGSCRSSSGTKMATTASCGRHGSCGSPLRGRDIHPFPRGKPCPFNGLFKSPLASWAAETGAPCQFWMPDMGVQEVSVSAIACPATPSPAQFCLSPPSPCSPPSHTPKCLSTGPQ